MVHKDFWRLLLLLTAATAIGTLSGQYLATIAAALLFYILWLHRNLQGLLSWLRDSKHHEAPEPPGIFEEIAIEIDYLRERHKKRKKKLATYLKQFQQATRALPDATVVLDEDGTVLWANSAATKYLGIRWPEDMGQRVTNLVRQPQLRDLVQGRQESTTLEIISPTQHERYLNVLLAAYGNNQWLLVARDVTELHRLNQMRSDFVANVSHELRTPTTVLKGYIESLLDQQHLAPPTWVPALDQMRTHADRMQSLIEELLLLSRLEQNEHATDLQPVRVSELMSDVIKQAQALSGGREHLISLEADPHLCLMGNAGELFSAFSNLVFNAVNYTPPRGVIQIRWGLRESGGVLEVQDNGVGIAEEHIGRITERFYRVDASRSRAEGGTGLGLAICKHVLMRHDAHLEIRSQRGTGSTFSCVFPESALRSEVAQRHSGAA